VNEQLFGEGFRVTTTSCKHKVDLKIDSYVSAMVSVNPAGAFTFECTDITPLYDAIIPTKLSAQVLGAIIGFSALPEELHEKGPDMETERMLLFTDEITLEMWLRQEFLPQLDVFEGEDVDEDLVSSSVDDMTRQIMSDLLGNKAKEQVRRNWTA